ncbi:hypothetical protein BpHYR1_023427 [Brachionus plicatilis]|uniref:Uncharacterized protein n=1 Tax=Brachionus plicatilis TaxID=10195 RepID=A0A3M7P3A0_BRAPC|nr:hypothetical protein BpHYR1_023427 [Brachionus plicatilis]
MTFKQSKILRDFGKLGQNKGLHIVIKVHKILFVHFKHQKFIIKLQIVTESFASGKSYSSYDCSMRCVILSFSNSVSVLNSFSLKALTSF